MSRARSVAAAKRAASKRGGVEKSFLGLRLIAPKFTLVFGVGCVRAPNANMIQTAPRRLTTRTAMRQRGIMNSASRIFPISQAETQGLFSIVSPELPKTGERRIIDYLLSPIAQTMDEAGRER
jgi:hypothetical protein